MAGGLGRKVGRGAIGGRLGFPPGPVVAGDGGGGGGGRGRCRGGQPPVPHAQAGQQRTDMWACGNEQLGGGGNQTILCKEVLLCARSLTKNTIKIKIKIKI